MLLAGVKAFLFRQKRAAGGAAPSQIREESKPAAVRHGSAETIVDLELQPPSQQQQQHQERQPERQEEQQQQQQHVQAPEPKSNAAGRQPNGSFRLDARVISDATIGLSDGLTVPFALTAGLSALGDTRIVIFGGLAELIAGAISMGLGGYLGAKSEAASYRETRSTTEKLVARDPQAAMGAIRSVLAPFAVPAQLLDDVTQHLAQCPGPRVVDFLMQFQHCAEEPAGSRAVRSALTIAMGYFVGGLLPLVPYFCVSQGRLLVALYISIGVMAVALFAFGYVKTCIVSGWRGDKCMRQAVVGGVQMVFVGGAAAGAAMGLVKAFGKLLPY
ncbi:VIT family-domain-containing protein [Bombardia bombarda]|uniref:VIT family-domain-containing protein n=1 Tax=Bombardia bombarda TaxID=252184 RepID=A0AA40C8J1_9PEZI|nr:VIT family-domain-containing protein [Bombardia bombarda]